ncbi:MAG: glycosyltransferase family 1 protein [Chloroflexi bacterium]|nr:MAG: glycosyltransferase family 1 protein [Chloroflexota bacterium]
MRIGIDYTAAVLQGAGIGRYTRGLVSALIPLLSDHRLTLLYPRETAPAAATDWPGNVDIRRLPLPDRWQTILWHRLHLPFHVEFLTGPLDLFHAPNFLLPPVRSARTLVTIHDLAFLVRPQFAHPNLRRFLERTVPASIARADHILADSEASRRDAIRLFGLSPRQVTVVGAGVEPRFRPRAASELMATRAKYGLHFPFVLSVATLEPRKNFDGLIRAFVAARQRRRLPHHLVIGGGKGWLYENIFAEVERQEAGDFVHFLGYVDDADLPDLYNLADLFAFPSHYEGFGLPVLEAMACGTAVLCTDTSSLPELAGDAAYMIPTGDEEALVEGLCRLLEDDTLRNELAARGPAQAAAWTWEAAARRLLRVYTAVAGRDLVD